MKYLLLAIVVFLLIFMTNCSDHSTMHREKQMIEIEIIDTNLSEVWIKVVVDTAYVGYQIYIHRDDEELPFVIWQDQMVKQDTIVKVVRYPVEAGNSYTYQASIVDGRDEIFFSNKAIATMLTPGPTQIEWQVDTVGIWQTALNGVWGSSPEDVYIVGDINVSGRELPYNVMHWDGQQWKFMDYLEGEPNEAFGFGSNDFWLAGDGGKHNALIGHWNGNEWQTWKFDEYGNLIGLWGTSSQNLYAVGLGGVILHYDGTNWRQMESGTTIPLRDIHGIGDKIYVVGGESSNNEGILLELKNNKWKIIYHDTYPANPNGGYGTTVWCASQFYTYLYLNPDIRLLYKIIGFGFDDRGTWINKIRGTGYNNIFAIGDYGLIIHSNGENELTMPFFEKPGGATMNDLMVFDDAVFVIGYTGGRGTIYRGTF